MIDGDYVDISPKIYKILFTIKDQIKNINSGASININQYFAISNAK